MLPHDPIKRSSAQEDVTCKTDGEDLSNDGLPLRPRLSLPLLIAKRAQEAVELCGRGIPGEAYAIMVLVMDAVKEAALSPDDERALRFLCGVTAERSGRLEEAATIFSGLITELAQLDSGDLSTSSLLVRLASVRLLQGEYAESLAQCSQVPHDGSRTGWRDRAETLLVSATARALSGAVQDSLIDLSLFEKHLQRASVSELEECAGDELLLARSLASIDSTSSLRDLRIRVLEVFLNTLEGDDVRAGGRLSTHLPEVYVASLCRMIEYVRGYRSSMVVDDLIDQGIEALTYLPFRYPESEYEFGLRIADQLVKSERFTEAKVLLSSTSKKAAEDIEPVVALHYDLRRYRILLQMGDISSFRGTGEELEVRFKRLLGNYTVRALFGGDTETLRSLCAQPTTDTDFEGSRVEILEAYRGFLHDTIIGLPVCDDSIEKYTELHKRLRSLLEVLPHPPYELGLAISELDFELLHKEEPSRERVEEFIEKVAQAAPTSAYYAQGCLALALLYQLRGEGVEAKEWMDRSTLGLSQLSSRLAPQVLTALYHRRASYFLGEGEPEASAGEYEKAIDVMVEHGTIYSARGQEIVRQLIAVLTHIGDMERVEELKGYL